MTLESVARVIELAGSLAVVISLVYLAVQVRDNTRVSSANARHAISRFALDLSIFKAENADRVALVESDAPLGAGDRTFQFWNHMTVFLHAETYFHHFGLGLMPADHWGGYVRFVEAYLTTRGVPEFWEGVGPAFSADYARWVDSLIEKGIAGEPPAPAP